MQSQGVVCLCERFEGDQPAGNIISLMTKCQISPQGLPPASFDIEAEEVTASPTTRKLPFVFPNMSFLFSCLRAISTWTLMKSVL